MKSTRKYINLTLAFSDSVTVANLAELSLLLFLINRYVTTLVTRDKIRDT